MLGDRRKCELALGAAETWFGRVDVSGPAAELYSPTRLGRLAGSRYLFLGEAGHAVLSLDKTGRSPQDRPKADALVFGNLSIAHARQGAVEDAACAVHAAIDVVEATWGDGGLNVVFRAGDEAVALSRAGQTLAGAYTHASAQLTMQQARAWARLGRAAETYAALDKAAAVVARLARPDRPAHHFVFDPRKLHLLHRHHPRLARRRRARRGIRPRGRPLLRRQREPRRLVPSNIWRASELATTLGSRYDGLPVVGEFRERCVQVHDALLAGGTDTGRREHKVKSSSLTPHARFTPVPGADDAEPIGLLNPAIVDQSAETHEQYEGCLSLFDVRGLASRARCGWTSRAPPRPATV